MATRNWLGTDETNPTLASVAANWDTPPVDGDTAAFSDGGDNDCDMDIDLSGISVTVEATFTKKITLGAEVEHIGGLSVAALCEAAIEFPAAPVEVGAGDVSFPATASVTMPAGCRIERKFTDPGVANVLTEAAGGPASYFFGDDEKVGLAETVTPAACVAAMVASAEYKTLLNSMRLGEKSW